MAEILIILPESRKQKIKFIGEQKAESKKAKTQENKKKIQKMKQNNSKLSLYLLIVSKDAFLPLSNTSIPIHVKLDTYWRRLDSFKTKQNIFQIKVEVYIVHSEAL